MSRPIVILGAGHAGGRCAAWLRELGSEEDVILVGAEPILPYERPPLSKGLLTGHKTVEDCHLREESFYQDQRIELLLGREVTALDLAARSLTLDDGGRLDFGRLVIASGARPRRLSLPGAALAGVCILRNVADSQALLEHLSSGARLVVVGGGFIGLEVAASARALGAEVVVLEATQQVLGRGVPFEIARDVVALHRAQGVDIRLGAQLAEILGDRRVSGVALADGTRIDCSAVVIGVGVVPETALAEAAGIPCQDGVLAGPDCATEVPEIFVIGDAARAHNRRYGRQMRLESWQNAEQQAEIAARALVGHQAHWDSVPWVWSDQHGWNLQVAGDGSAGGEFVIRGQDGDTKRLGFVLKDDRLVGAAAFGQGLSAAKDLRVAQMLIERNTPVAAAALADPGTSLKSLLKQSQVA